MTACSNLLMMRSFERSPNPGISVALLSTQSVWLTFISTLLFGTALGRCSAGGVLLVVVLFLTNATLNKTQALATVLIVAGIVVIRLWS